MLVKPDLEDQRICDCLKDNYGIECKAITFLPLGADANTAVYRADTKSQAAYFVKLRREEFQEASVEIPNFLHGAGIKQIIPAIQTLGGTLWADLAPYNMILYRFVRGRNGFEVNLTDQHRVMFGEALRRLHHVQVPAALARKLPREQYSPYWRQQLRSWQQQLEAEPPADPLIQDLKNFLGAHKELIAGLVIRAEQYANALITHQGDHTLCHGDIHGWNLFIDDNGAIFIVDWDTMILAPKERDLMFIGCGLGGNGHSLEEETRLFYQGYGETEVNSIAVAYYRFERIIVDIVEFCKQICSLEENRDERIWALQTLQANFQLDNTVDLAFRLDKLQNS